MTSEMQRDIERIEPLIPFDPETREAWQRIRQRLTPNRLVDESNLTAVAVPFPHCSESSGLDLSYDFADHAG